MRLWGLSLNDRKGEYIKNLYISYTIYDRSEATV